MWNRGEGCPNSHEPILLTSTKDHPNKGMMFGWSVLGQTGLGFDFRNKQSWDVVKDVVKKDKIAMIKGNKPFNIRMLMHLNCLDR